jgi:hypothetical protein
MFSKLLSAAALALVVTVSSATTASAAPLFLDPNVNYVSHGDALFIQDASNYSLTINNFMSIDDGTGFVAVGTGTLNVSVVDGLGSFALTMGSGDSLQFATGTLVSDSMIDNIVGGHDIFAIFEITESTVEGFVVGQLAGFDAFSWNCHDIGNGIEACRAKGDLAPVVPEPASLSLVVLGLGGLMVRARRKLS